jgi:hypothetical protein
MGYLVLIVDNVMLDSIAMAVLIWYNCEVSSVMSGEGLIDVVAMEI